MYRIRLKLKGRINKMAVAILKRKQSVDIDIQSKIDRIVRIAPVIKATGDAIELDYQNQQHRDWYEIDKYQGQ